MPNCEIVHSSGVKAQIHSQDGVKKGTEKSQTTSFIK